MIEPVILSRLDDRGIAELTFNRPAVGNAYDGEMIETLSSNVAALARDAAVRVVVLRGNGKHFCTGADINWLGDSYGSGGDEIPGKPPSLADALRALDGLAKPTMALVHGACIGGGIGIAACCDIVVAAQTSFFSIPEIRIGFSPGPIVAFLDAAIGPRQSRRYALSGERFDAAEARRIGLVHEVCPDGGLDQAAAPIIEALLLGAPVAIAETKQMIGAAANAPIDDALFRDLEERGAQGRRSAEAAEGRASFREKRKPDWTPG